MLLVPTLPLLLSFFFFSLFLAVPGLCCRSGFSLVVARKLLIAMASPTAEHGLQGTRVSAIAALEHSSIVVVHGPSCSAAYGISQDQGSNLCPLHWQTDSPPLSHQGNPYRCFLRYLALPIFKPFSGSLGTNRAFSWPVC